MALKDHPPTQNPKGMLTRPYADLLNVFRTAELRCYIGALSKYDKPFLLYSSNGGCPITFAVWPTIESNEHVYLAFGCWRATISIQMMDMMLTSATDRSTMVSFLMVKSTPAEYPSRYLEYSRGDVYEGLLQLRST